MPIHIQEDNMKIRKIVSKKDIVIPRGTVFECIDGSERKYCSGNYEALIDLSRDNCGSFIIGDEFDDKDFEYLKK